MKNDNELEKQIQDLESELKASMRREELGAISGGSGRSLFNRIKDRIKRSVLWRTAKNPDSKVGKVIRSPRTIFRIVTNPSVAREIREKNRHVKENKKSNESLFMPIKFFFGEGTEKRINIVLENVELDLINMGILLANQEKIEIRIIATKEGFGPVLYRKLLKDKKIVKAERISFYSTTEQNVRPRVFELEVSKDDIFITKAWKNE